MRLQVQAHLAREAREATALAQRELAAAVRDLVTEREASARLHEQLQATDNELRRREGERSAEREEMQARIEVRVCVCVCVRVCVCVCVCVMCPAEDTVFAEQACTHVYVQLCRHIFADLTCCCETR